MAPAVELTGVTKSFRNVLAVDQLDLVVPRGAVYGFIGPNGSGKTTTLRMIMRIYYPDMGRVVVLGVFQDKIELDPWPLLLKEATLVWSLCYTRAAGNEDFVEAVRLLAEHPDLFARVLTHEVPLAEIDRAFALADDKSSGAIKVTVTP